MHVSVKIIVFLGCFSYVVPTPIPENADSVRIVNGYEVDIQEVPYQASVRRKVQSGWSHMCGASIISSRGILTAAHCVESYTFQPLLLRVAVGTSYRHSGGKTYDVSVVIVHEEYSSSTLEHDIALLWTAKTISFSLSIAPIAIAGQSYKLTDGTEALVSGFGTTSYVGSSSPVLLAARVKIVPQESCARAYLRIASISLGMVCANASNPPRDACQGDSGGPLAVKNTLVGIVSWGEGCASMEYPGVYTRVSAYANWIKDKFARIQSDTTLLKISSQ